MCDGLSTRGNKVYYRILEKCIVAAVYRAGREKRKRRWDRRGKLGEG